MENLNFKKFEATLHFRERYKERLEDKIGKFKKSNLNKYTYQIQHLNDGNTRLTTKDFQLVVNLDTKILITCYANNKKRKMKNTEVEDFIQDSYKVLMKHKKNQYTKFLKSIDTSIERLNKNLNIERTTQPKDVQMKMDQIDKDIDFINREYKKIKTLCLQFEEAFENSKKEFKK